MILEEQVSSAKISPKDSAILSEMKEKIKNLPLDERITAVALYREVQKYFQTSFVFEEEEERLKNESQEKQNAVMQKCQEIITGQRACTNEELSELNQFLGGTEIYDMNEHNTPERIPDYWATVLKNSEIYMNNKDYDALKFIETFDVKEKEDNDEGYVYQSLQIGFRENPFFTNNVLEIKLTLKKDIPKYSKGTEINWNPGKNLCTKTIEKKQKHKKTGKVRIKKKTIKQKSFFRLFDDFDDKDDDKMDSFDGVEEQPSLYLVTDTMETLHEMFRYSLEYYLNCVEESSDEEDDDYEDESEDGDSSEPSSHSEHKKPKRSRKTKKKLKEPSPAEQECKQQ